MAEPKWVQVRVISDEALKWYTCWCYEKDCEQCYAHYFCGHGDEDSCLWCKDEEEPSESDKNRQVG